MRSNGHSPALFPDRRSPARWVWRRFVTPDEAGALLAASGLQLMDVSGVTLNLFTQDLQLSRNTAVNYILTAGRGG
jgi:2-polyprenyl-6-hydroxyphenyl methylase/3-demethylubiquinone-9 3-methyltransferase